LKAHGYLPNWSKREIIHHKDFDHLNNDITNLEILTVSEHNKLHHNGCKRSEEARRKMSKANKGRRKKPFTNEHKRNMSLALKGNKNGRPHSEQGRKNISNALKKAWARRKGSNNEQ
jgi:hypothetical protein